MDRVIADRFIVERLVGSGGMGEVFRAKDKVGGEKVAVKVLFASMARDAARFKQEALILADIKHPRVVRYIAHGVIEGGRPWLAMEWLDGEDLADRLERQGLGLRDTITLARRTAEALGALHDRGIVHRDVKPSNIFLPDRDVDRAKILDLGVARILQSAHQATRSGVMVGTPGYMAPEQARGTREIDARADIFALGCVLYECIAGRPAFVGENIAALLAKILLETPPTLRDAGCEIPPALDELVMRMLAKAPATRPANGGALVKELEAFGPIADGPAIRASTPAMRALTAGERRLVCVVMSASPMFEAPPDTEPGGFGPTDSGSETMAASFDPRTLVTSFGAEAEILADGTIVATLTGMGGAGDQAAQAARCALALRSHMIDAPVVLATGLAHMTGRSAVGEVIERAAAILDSARARQGNFGEETLGGQSPVYLDETTAGLLDMGFDVGGDERGLFIRGLRERDAKARTLLGKPTPFVGRDRELATLEALFEECAEEPVARAVLVTGFPGAGKSRLVAEMMRQMQRPGRVTHTARAPEGRAGVELWIARGDTMSQGSPFALVARLLRRGAGISGGEPLVVRQQKLRARVARNVTEGDVQRVTEFLGEIASIPFPDTDSVQLRAARQDAILMGDQMRRAFCDLVIAEASAGPFVLVLEDLHWGDLPSVNLLDAALRVATEYSFMVLAVARGEVHDAFPQLWAQRSLQEVRLGPLVRRAGEKLIRDVLGEDLPATEVARLLDRAAGNAFYLEELIRAFAEGTGRVTRVSIPPPGTVPPPPTSSTAMIRGETWSLPTTVLAMVEARLQRLDPMARRVMRAASVFGEAFWRGGVVALTGGQYKATEIDEWLAELVRREIVQRRDGSRFELEAEYIFRHAIVRDAAYQMLTTDDQALGHRLAADWLEKAGEDDPMVLGEHFERGGNRTRAALFYGRAAFQALEGNDFVAAKVRADRAIQAGALGAENGRLQLILAEASRWSGEHEPARAHATAALAALEPRSDDWYAAAAEATEAAMTLGHSDEAHGIAVRLTELAGEAPMTAARVIASARIAIVLGVAGMYEVAGALLAPIEAATDLLEREPSAKAFLLSANVARAMRESDLERAVVLAEKAVASFEVVGDARNATRQRLRAGTALAELGVYVEAEHILTRAREDAERLGLLAVASDSTLRLAFVCMRTGRYDHAVALTNEIIQTYSAQRDLAGEGQARAYLACVFYYGGHFEAAAEESKRCLALFEHTPPYRAALLGFLSLTLMHKGAPAAEVLSTAKEAIETLEQLTGIAEGESVVRIAWAEALYYSQDLEGAKKAVVAARDRLLERASKITNPLYKRAFLGGVRENGRTLARAGEWLA